MLRKYCVEIKRGHRELNIRMFQFVTLERNPFSQLRQRQSKNIKVVKKEKKNKRAEDYLKMDKKTPLSIL